MSTRRIDAFFAKPGGALKAAAKAPASGTPSKAFAVVDQNTPQFKASGAEGVVVDLTGADESTAAMAETGASETPAVRDPVCPFFGNMDTSRHSAVTLHSRDRPAASVPPSAASPLPVTRTSPANSRPICR